MRFTVVVLLALSLSAQTQRTVPLQDPARALEAWQLYVEKEREAMVQAPQRERAAQELKREGCLYWNKELISALYDNFVETKDYTVNPKTQKRVERSLNSYISWCELAKPKKRKK